MLISNGISFSGGVTITAPIPITYLTDPYYYNTVLHLNGETPTPIWISDASTVTNAITTSGNVVPSRFSPILPQGYYSNQFDGSTGYLTVPANAAFSFGTGDFTVELWAYIGAVSNTNGKMMIDSRPANTNGSYWNFGLNATGVAGFTSMTTGGTTINATSAYPNQWVHYAATRQGTSLRLFVNGVLVASATDSSNISSSGLFIGTNAFYSSATDTYWSGYMSNIRIIKGTALYTSNFTPSTVPLTVASSNTSLLTCLGPSFTDYANNSAITVVGTVKVQTVQPFGALPSTVSNPTNGYYSNYFNGSSSYLSFAPGNSTKFGTNNFTFEAWVYLTSAQSNQYIFDARDSSNTTGWALGWGLITTGQLSWYNGSGATTTDTSTTDFGINTWNHVAYVRNGSIGVLYRNGVAVSIAADSTNYTVSGAANYIGNRYSAVTGSYFGGYISNLRIVNGTALYTNNFIPPTQPLTIINSTQTVLLTSLNQQLTDSSINNFALTNTSGVTVVTQVPFTVPTTSTAVTALGSGQFDGTTGYLTIPASTSTIVGTKDFTIEFWVYPTIAPSTSWNAYFSMGASGGGQEIRISQNMNGGGFGFLIPNNASSADSYAGYGTLVLNQWHHLALVRYGSVVTIYRNGTAAGSLTGVTFNYTNTGSILVGADKYPVDGYTGGYVSNVRMVSGVALYTSNFAPSNQPLTVATNTTGSTVLLTLQNRQSNNNNIFYDDSPNNFAVTRVGTPTQGSFTPFSQNGWSNYFDGSSGYLSYSGIVIGTNAFTIEFWFYANNFTNTVAPFGTGNNNGLSVRISPTTTQFTIDSFGTSNTSFTVPAMLTNTWYHVAVVRNSSNATTIFLNGVRSTTGAVTVTTNFSGVSNWIGYFGSGYYFPGYISNMRVITGASAYDPTQSTITVPTLALTTATGTTGTVALLTAQSNRFLDNSTYSNTLTVTGSVQVIPYSPFANQSLVSNSYSTTLVGGSVYFNGSSYLTLPSNGAFSVPAGSAFTLEMWLYWTGSYATTTRLFSFYTSGIILYPNTSGNLVYGVYGGPIYITSSQTIPLNSWLHVAVFRTSTPTIITTMCFNGVSVGSSTTDTGSYGQTGGYIGTDNGTSFWTGYIANLRFVVGSALYTANFTPPTAPPSVVAPITTISTSTSTIASTSLLLLGTNSGIVDQTGRNDLISVGTATISASTFKYGAGSIYIPGTGNYLQTTGTRYWIPTGLLTFTIEAWIYMTQLPTGTYTGMIGDMAIGGTNYLSFGPISTGALQLYWFPGGSVAVTGNTIMSTSTWNHIAVSVNAGAIGLFVNGVNQTLTGTTTLSARSGTVNYLTVGQSGSLQYYGYIDDLRVTQGVARYSTGTNFTLPSVQPVQ